MNPDVEGRKRKGYGYREGVVPIPPALQLPGHSGFLEECLRHGVFAVPSWAEQGRAGQGIAAVEFPFPWGWHEEIHL